MFSKGVSNVQDMFRKSTRNIGKLFQGSKKFKSTKKPMQYEKKLLPTTVVAKHYDLSITPKLEEDFKYTGHVDISVDVTKQVDSITLHAKELEIQSCIAKTKNKEVTSSEVTFDAEETTVTFKFPENLSKGEYILSMDFEGLHNTQMNGFYRSTYKNALGEEKTMVSTQFEASDARRCFPCFDEPAAKATFRAALTIPNGLTALSNMPEVSRVSVTKDTSKVQFETSPKMSTYLLAFCVGQFDFIESPVATKTGTKLRIYTTPGKTSEGEFALEVGVRCLDLYDSMFGVPFPLPKMDMIAIPEFAAGAMENWGLVTYREVELLLNDKNASGNHRQRVAIVVAHELAHQWFGNLVTMKWWDDLWLNEGFASWMENYAVDQLFPEWKLWDQFVTDAQASAMSMDSLKTSHPVQVPIPSAHDVDEVFDAISYSKGACVIQIVYSYIGHDNFINGLKAYMQKHQYGNAETKDLCDAWTKATKNTKDVFSLVHDWTRQMGYPLLTVAKTEKANVLDAKQEWFLADGSEGELRKWIIPMFAKTIESQEELRTFDKQEGKITVPEGFVKLNADQKIMLRVNYSVEMWEAITEQIKTNPTLLSVADKSGLVQDCYALVKAGKLAPGILMNLISAFKEETSYIVWDAVTTVLFGVHEALTGNDKILEKFEEFSANLVKPMFMKLGWETRAEDSHLDKLLRSLMMSCVSKFVHKDEEILAEARRRFKIYEADPNAEIAGEALPMDYRGSVLKLLLKQEGEESTKMYESLRKLMPTIKNDAEYQTVLGSVGYVASMEKKKEVLDWATTTVKIQDFFYPIGAVAASSSEARQFTWDYFKENYERITERIKSANVSILEAVVIYSARGFNTPEKAVEIKEFFDSKENFRAPRTIQQLVEATENRVKFTEKFKALEAYFE